MTYPRIYSISTVGILKHYNQDYLFHPIRTDFAGSNGIGKSIIADLLQLIFIPDSNVFRFGTEGIDNESRQIYKLANRTNNAYAFLNIEVRSGFFVTVGVCIPGRKSGYIRSFLALNSNNTSDNLTELAYPSSKLLTSKNFIKNKTIPSVEDLAKHFRDSLSLSFLYYTNKSQKNDFYTFLFNKQILPINLSIENNFRAFAKIIQSFSKAKSLNLGNSNSLKQFLLEDKGKEYKQIFNKCKVQLKDLFNEYKTIVEYTSDLEQKQKSLSALKQREDKKNELQKEYFKKQLLFKFQEKKQVELELRKLDQDLAEYIKEQNNLQQRKLRLEKIIDKVKENLERNKKILCILNEYKSTYLELKNIQTYIKELADLEIPKILDDITIDLDIKQYENREIIRRVKLFKLLYEQYGSLALMKQKCLKQEEELNNYRQQTKDEINKVNKIIEALGSSHSGTLLSKFIEQERKLSIEQETVLFHLSDIRWEKPEYVEQGTKYTTSTDILGTEAIEQDSKHNGIWIDYGNLKEFLLLKRGKQIFDKPQNLKFALNSTINELEILLEEEKQKLVQIENFKTGKDFDIPELNLDARLKDYTAFEQIEETGFIIQNIDRKIATYKQEEDTYSQSLAKVQLQIRFTIERSHLGKHIEKTQTSIDIDNKRLRNLENTQSKESGKLEALPSTISLLERSVSEKKDNLEDCTIDYIKTETKFRTVFPDTQIDRDAKNIDSSELEEQRISFENAQTEYITEYKSIVNLFQETKEKNYIEINNQLDDKLYNFFVLEKVLLGDKIMHSDKIAEEILDANRRREEFANAIYDIMFSIFSGTRETYNEYKDIIRRLNSFFEGRKISNRYFFQVNFKPHSIFNIDWVNQLQAMHNRAYKFGELALGELTVDTFIEDFFKQTSNYQKNIQVVELLDPKKYFDLSVSLTDENNNEIPGSTGESYSAIVLLGIGRLSIVQSSRRQRKGIKFVILEETASLDGINFNTFPRIAEEFSYQIITMTPKPYGENPESERYLHHLIKGNDDPNINSTPASYFIAKKCRKNLELYLKTTDNELDCSSETISNL